MRCEDIHIRDPFVLAEDDTYYLYGTRAANFGQKTGGFDVYTSRDLVHWSDPVEVFDSERHGLNAHVNWAPEVHQYRGAYYMFATFTKPDGLRGTYILRAEKPQGPFLPHSAGAVTPDGWECLDGTLYVAKNAQPYLVFCHEHTQIINGTVCALPLKADLTAAAGDVLTLFCATDPQWAEPLTGDAHGVTDGPFLFRGQDDRLYLFWSTFVRGQYAECVARFRSGEIGTDIEHLPVLIDSDGGHGMLFRTPAGKLYLTYHTPNRSGEEHPVFVGIRETADGFDII